MILAALAQRVIDGVAESAGLLTQAALAEDIPPSTVLEEGLLAGMRVVGVRFRDGQMFLPDVLGSARAMKQAMRFLEPALGASGIEPRGTILMGTVKGDIHDIGKNLVSVMLRGAGLRVIDLGINVPAEKFVAAVAEHRPHIIGMSALLTTTMTQMQRNLEIFRTSGISAPVMVGGAVVTRQWAEQIGAVYVKDASSAVTCALELLKSAGANV